jgi:hypothetical protein
LISLPAWWSVVSSPSQLYELDRTPQKRGNKTKEEVFEKGELVKNNERELH